MCFSSSSSNNRCGKRAHVRLFFSPFHGDSCLPAPHCWGMEEGTSLPLPLSSGASSSKQCRRTGPCCLPPLVALHCVAFQHVCVRACMRECVSMSVCVCVFHSFPLFHLWAPSCVCCGGVVLTRDIVTVGTFNECLDRVSHSPFVKQVCSRWHLALNPAPPAMKEDTLTDHHYSSHGTTQGNRGER